MRDTRELTFKVFADELADSRRYDYIIDEMFWGDGYSAEQFYKLTVSIAETEKVIIIDKDDFSYDEYFWNLWQSTEKGLS